MYRAWHPQPEGGSPLSGDEREERVRRAIGATREERVVLAFALPGILPRWFRSVRPGTEAEDHNGIDVVVETHDMGTIGVQVKGCRVGVERFRRMHPDPRIAVVIVREADSDQDVLRKTIRAIMQVRFLLATGRTGQPS